MDACVFGAKDTDAETTRLDALELSNAGCSGVRDAGPAMRRSLLALRGEGSGPMSRRGSDRDGAGEEGVG